MTRASHVSSIAVPRETAAFLDQWHAIVAAPSASRLDTLLAPDAAISSPAFWAPKQDRAYVANVLMAVAGALEDFRYDREWADGHELLLEFSAHIGDKALRGIDRISIGPDGRMRHIEVMIRPANALMALAETVKGAFAA